MVNQDVVDIYRHTFAARCDVYSRWTPDGWRPVRSEMTVDVVAGALLMETPPISAFFIAPGNTTHVAAVDFDSEDGSQLASVLANHLYRAGVPSYIELSRRGAHLWMCLERSHPAKQVRAALAQWCEEAGMPRVNGRLSPKVELRPASDHISDDGVGHALRMPLMPHPKTNLRYSMTDATGALMPTKLKDLLLEVQQVPADAIEKAAMMHRPVIDPASIPMSYRTPKAGRADDGSLASDILAKLWGCLNARPGRAVKCPAHDDEHPSLSILKDDKRAICHSPSCILHNDGRGRGTWELTTLAAHRER